MSRSQGFGRKRDRPQAFARGRSLLRWIRRLVLLLFLALLGDLSRAVLLLVLLALLRLAGWRARTRTWRLGVGKRHRGDTCRSRADGRVRGSRAEGTRTASSSASGTATATAGRRAATTEHTTATAGA